VELGVPEATPIEFVVVAGCVSVFPLPETARTIVAPLTEFPKPSFAVTRIVEVSLSGAMLVGAALTADVAPETALAVTVTALVCVIATPSAVAEMVFSSALFDDSVPVATPLASVGPEGCTRVFWVPVDASTTFAPLTGSPLLLRTVTVTVASPEPAVIDAWSTPTLDCDPDTDAGVTVTIAVCVTPVPLIVAETVFVSATDEPSDPVATPFAFVAPAG